MRDMTEPECDMPWRCVVCDSAEIVAIFPGSEPVRDLFLLKRDIPVVAYCRTCLASRLQARVP